MYAAVFHNVKAAHKHGQFHGAGYDELPLFLNAATVAKALGIAPSSSYELMREKDFPALRIGNRIVVPKEAFIRWVEKHTVVAE